MLVLFFSFRLVGTASIVGTSKLARRLTSLYPILLTLNGNYADFTRPSSFY